MPNRWTFEIPPIRDLIVRYVGDGKGWVDPFSGRSTLAEWRNDIDSESSAPSHMEAEAWLRQLSEDKVRARGIIFDPPYSPRQIAEVYGRMGLNVGMEETQNARLYSRVRQAAMSVLDGGATAISCGWNSAGFGKDRGFVLIEILLVAHGGGHNDTIVVVERRSTHILDEFAGKVAEATPVETKSPPARKGRRTTMRRPK